MFFMEATEANNIPLEFILSQYERTPIKCYQNYDMYCSPFRNENNPSFKVDKLHNKWQDFGSGEYGSPVDLVMKLENCTFLDAMEIFEQRKFNQGYTFEDLERKQAETEKPHSSLILLKTADLNNKILLNYLQSRGIDQDVAQKYCKEIYYKIGEQGRNCFAVAFENNNAGIEFRNPMFKGCAISKDITTIDNGSGKCAVFEGFMDLLTYVQISKNKPNRKDVNFVVLNSATMLERSIDFLKKHETIHAFLDNDHAGKAAFQKLKKSGLNVFNESAYIYPKHKDLNEFWMEQLNLDQSSIKKKEVTKSVKSDYQRNDNRRKSFKI